ncbi:MAG TPA: type I secretion C-terminal target domain-containing protein [Alphaproteobacteria bacterium]|nr:type I secretion C-terminal target domain-containing protein [Alphaproteobacteria bacterium]
MGIGGFAINAESAGDLVGMSVAAGGDFNRDGLADIVIGAPHNGEGGTNAGAVYLIWGGANTTVDLSLVAQGVGGAKIVGVSGSLTGSSVATLGDLNGDATPDLLVGSPGSAYESVSVIFSPVIWQPDINVYGTNGIDIMGAGYGGLHRIGGGDDNIVGLAGNDVIDAGGGNDTLDGGVGADSMTGGSGNDTYYVDNAGDTVTEVSGGGNDTVLASISYILSAEIENLTLTASGLSGTGNALSNTLNGTAGMDTLDGGAGIDTMNGGLGNDTYKVDVLGDIINDAGGIDTVITTVDSYVLAATIENITLDGTAHVANGNGLNNIVTGTSADDTLNGGGGIDTLNGGLGNDTYYVDNAADNTVESAAGGGVDTVYASVSYTLRDNVEALYLSASGLVGTGNSLNNTLVGTPGDDTLDGGLGADTMQGGLGNDTYKVDNIADTIVDTGGMDTVFSTADGYILGTGIENLTLSGAARHGTGNAGTNTLIGTAGDDTLDGAAGSDALVGGDGNDTYFVDSLGDSVTESLTGGNADTVNASVDGYILGANIEGLRLIGSSHSGVGNASNNVLFGGVGSDTLSGLDGDDSIDGGAGSDTMIGGNGDDTYYIDDLNDVVVEGSGVGSGNDTVIANFSYVLSDNVENARVTGAGHSVTGNGGSNIIAGESGDDTLDGGAGDDTELGGDGDDHLISNSGRDNLNGGSGDDTYHIHGGSAHIEDFLGHDTIDVSDGIEDNYIDLSGNTHSNIENEDCDLGQGGTTVSPLDVQFLQDLTGSFSDDIANVKVLAPQIVSALQAVQANSEFGVSSFVDKAVSPFGVTGEWVYRMHLGLTADALALGTTYNGLTTNNGADAPECQIESLMHLSLHAGDVGFRPDSARFVVLFTDAPFHVAGDGAAGGILTPNNGDGVLDGVVPGTGEDYPFIAQVKTALELANIIPIFAIAGGYESTYQGLVADLGRGTVVTLTSDSSNVVAAITSGLTAATVTTIEDCKGGYGNDTISGNDAANALYGNGGDDTLYGGKGDDVLNGGAGIDASSYGGVSGDYKYQSLAGAVTITDNNLLNGNEGRDTLSGIETLTFVNGTVHLDTRVYNGTSNTDSFTAFSNENWTLHGLEGNDSLKGRNGSDVLYGDAGDDRLYGKIGNDTLIGGLGNDTLYGGDGNDVFLYSNVSTVEGYDKVFGEIGNDTIRAGSTNTAIGLQEISGIETITADGFAGVKIKAASTDQVFDFSGVNLVGISAVEMGSGNDTVIGSAGSDALKGQAGLDRLNGGGGIDLLYGGTEADTFVFDVSAFSGRDSVKDFSVAGGDVLELHGILTGYDPLTSLITDFVAITDNGLNSYVSVDTDGAANGHAWTQIARLDAALGLTNEAQLLLDGRLTVVA